MLFSRAEQPLYERFGLLATTQSILRTPRFVINQKGQPEGRPFLAFAKHYRRPGIMGGFFPAFLAARFAAIACISLPICELLIESWIARLMMLPVHQ